MFKNVYIYSRDIRRLDAVGRFCVDVQRALSLANINALLIAENFDAGGQIGIIPARDGIGKLLENPDNLLFYNHSIGDPLLEDLSAIKNKKVFYFHNITPPELIPMQDNETRANCDLGYKQLKHALRFDVLLANSNFSAEVLSTHVELGRKVFSVPPIISDIEMSLELHPPRLGESLNLVYVGRCSPHKNLSELFVDVKKWQALRPVKLEVYTSALGSLDIPESSDGIEIIVGASDRSVEDALERSDALITYSRHEGFCVPACLAVQYGKPVLHLGNKAVAETAGPFGAVIVRGEHPQSVVSRIGASELERQTMLNWQEQQRLRISPKNFLRVFHEAFGKAYK